MRNVLYCVINLYAMVAVVRADCSSAKVQINSSTCNTAVEILDDITESNDEVKVDTDNSNNLNQAYTCVKIKTDTNDYIGNLSVDESKIIPLVGEKDFDSITIEWFDSTSLNVLDNFDVHLPATNASLYSQLNWVTNNYPPIMKAQLIQFSEDGFRLGSFDLQRDDESNTDTLFLYPSQIGLDETSFINDKHKVSSNSPTQIKCRDNLAAGGYACSAKISLPSPVGGGDRNAFLNLSTYYNGANYRVSMEGEDVLVKFDAVQPEIDSTGRASDLFRRVKSRVELGGFFPYPQAEIDITGNLCKNFFSDR